MTLKTTMSRLAELLLPACRGAARLVVKALAGIASVYSRMPPAGRKTLLLSLIVGCGVMASSGSFGAALRAVIWTWGGLLLLAALARSTAGIFILMLTGLSVIVVLFGLGSGDDGDGCDGGGCDG